MLELAGAMLWSFMAGFMLILSPCVLPMLQIMSLSALQKQKNAPFWMFLGLVFAFTLVSIVTYYLLGTTDMGRYVGNALLFLIGVVIIVQVFDLASMHRSLARFASCTERWLQEKPDSAFWLGFGLGGLWAPCVGPVTGGMIVLIARGSLAPWPQYMAFLCGLGVPVLGYSYGLKHWFSRHQAMLWGHKVFMLLVGVLCMVFSLGYFFQVDLLISGVVLESFSEQWWSFVYGFDPA